MTTIGDVLTVLGTLISIGFCSWAALLLTAHLWPRATQRASEQVVQQTGRRLVSGLVVGVVGILLSVLLFNAPSPLFKLLGAGLLAFQFGVGLFGGAAVVRYLAEQMVPQGDGQGTVRSLSSGSIFLTATAMFPILGWLIFAPLLHAFCLGLGMKALSRKRFAPAPMSAPGVQP